MSFLLFFAGVVATMMLSRRAWAAEQRGVDETEAAPGEWGFRPGDGSLWQMTPPGFSWRPQEGARFYELQCARDDAFSQIDYEAKGITFNVHCPPRTLPAGGWFWRFRFYDTLGDVSEWSRTRAFTLAADAKALPLPLRGELIARIPKTHPRLFVRPEQIPGLRKRAKGDLETFFDDLVAESEDLMAEPPPTAEPPLYSEDMVRGGDPWREVWWGNRMYTIRALNGAATLAFTRLLGGKAEYGQLAKQILMACAEWDPKGATGYRYNDEAGMPYNYYFSRTYTFLYEALSEPEREKCREVMAVRGREMYDHLCPRHLWQPYGSHANRAWHFLGEIGIAFLDEIPDAAAWVWFVANVFACSYPVWNDEYGGWHEGTGYWRSYMNRFTWWADIMRVAMGIDAFQKPYFSLIGTYPMYLQPPGTKGGGFGDLTAHLDSAGNCRLMSIFAAQAQNPYWQWYVEAHGGVERETGYVGFVRGALPKVAARAPADLPTSRCFWGVGQAMLNATIADAKDNVEVIFKSSPFGTWSHGYESQNSFLLYAFGERLFIRTGRRDSYGSDHHKEWMWHSKSTNCVTVNGEGQAGHSQAAVGEIVDFHTSAVLDYVAGEAAAAYEGKLERFTRRILFVKPEAVIIFDTLVAPQPASFEWRLHAPVEMAVNGQADIRVVNGNAACQAAFLWPQGLDLSQTDRFDTPPRPRIKLVEYHLTAKPPEPAGAQTFVTVLRPHRAGETLAGEARLEEITGGYAVRVPLSGGEVRALLQADGGTAISGMGLTTDGQVGAVVFDAEGKGLETFVAGGDRVEVLGG